MKKILLTLFLIPVLAIGQDVTRPFVRADKLCGWSLYEILADTGANKKFAAYHWTTQQLLGKLGINATAANSSLFLGKDTTYFVGKALSDYQTLHSTFTSGTLTGKTTQKTVNEALDSYIQNYRVQYQGLAWNESTDTYQRLGSLAGLATGASPGNGNLPVQSKLRGCLLLENGTVNYYLNDYDWNYKASGAASKLDGTDGQVMVEIQAFYIKYEKYGNWHAWYVSLYPLPGYVIHPAFIKNGVQVAYRYIGAYEGVLYDNSASIYANGLYLPADTVTFTAGTKTIAVAGTFPTNPFTGLEAGDKIKVTGTSSNNVTFTVATIGDKSIVVSETVADETANAAVIQTEKDYTATTGDKLSSVSGKLPITYLTRANSRVLASNRGTGWRQLDYDLVNALEWMILIEYGTFYIQNIADVGPGVTAVSGWANYNNSNPFNISTAGNVFGNSSYDNAGNASIATEKTKVSRYRGITNFYGHVTKWIDGININDNKLYVSNVSANWADNTATNYTDLSITLANSNGYQSALANSSRAMLPTAVAGVGNTFVTDYYYQSTGWRVACFGGGASYGTHAGAWYWGLSSDSGSAGQLFGARLAF